MPQGLQSLQHTLTCRQQHLLIILGVVLLGTIVRLNIVVRSDFPVTDGGLFYVMVNDLQANHYVLPQYTTYNNDNIPFIYPPLSIYIIAGLSDLLRIDTLQIFRFLPSLFNILTIAVVYCFTWDLFQSKGVSGVAAVIVAIRPAGLEWMIAGGGVTRAAGLLWATLTIYHAYLLYTRPRRRRYLWTTMLFGAAALTTHPNFAFFAVYSTAIFFIFYGLSVGNVLKSIVVSLGIIALTAPYWFYIMRVHNYSLIVSAFVTGSSVGSGSIFGLLHSIFSSVRGIFQFRWLELGSRPIAYIDDLWVFVPFFGILKLIKTFFFVVPVWLVMDITLQWRNRAGHDTIPLAMIAAVGLVQVIWPALSNFAIEALQRMHGVIRRYSTIQLPVMLCKDQVQQGMRLAIASLTLLAGIFVGIRAAQYGKVIAFITPADRTAMTWIATHTLPDSRILVIPGSSQYANNGLEWFPALSDRHSVITAQGYEWGNKWQEKDRNLTTVGNCVSAGITCVADALETAHVAFTYLVLPSEMSTCCASFVKSVENASGYQLVFDKAGARIYAKKDDTK